MDVFIKIAPHEFSRLRDRISSESPAREAIDKATPIIMPSRASYSKDII